MTPLCTSEYKTDKICRRFAYTLHRLEFCKSGYELHRALFDYYTERSRTVN